MINKTVVTNLRMDYYDWVQIKAMAGEAGMSVNEYIKGIIKSTTTINELAAKPKIKVFSNRVQEPIWRLGDIKAGEPMSLNKDDQEIYGE